MTMTDPFADMLTRIRNANVAMHDEVRMPASKLKESLATVLKAEGYIEGYAVADNSDRPGSTLTIVRLSGASGTGTSVRCSRNCPPRAHSNRLRTCGPFSLALDGVGWSLAKRASTTHSPTKTSRRASASGLCSVTAITFALIDGHRCLSPIKRRGGHELIALSVRHGERGPPG